MKAKIKGLLKDDFFRHTFIMAMGTGVVNVFNLLYHLILVRVLSSVQYGVLNSLVAITVFFSIFVSPLRPTLTKFLSGYFHSKEFSKIFFVLRHIFKRLGLLSILFFGVFTLINLDLAKFLRIESAHYLTIVGIIVALSMLAPAFQSFLQSAQLFKMLAFVGIVSVAFKLMVGSGLAYAGFGALGGLLGYLVVPVLIIFVDMFLIIRYCRRNKIDSSITEPVEISPIYKYFLPTGVAMFSFTMLTSMDIVLVKHFFTPQEAGYYSVAQMVGKIILFLPGAVSMVLFPKTAALHANNIKGTHLLKKSLVIVALSCGTLATICIMFPGPTLKLLTSKVYPQSIKLVAWFALSMSFYALLRLVNFFHLSTNNTKFVLPIFSLAVIQMAVIYFFHPTLQSVLFILLTFSVLSFCVSLFTLRYAKE